ncbi:uncharacterized protein LOC132192879 [Neocloeon triangulifer]|uniref:uncharacterized protein LOC132192879 n=1 Tax=Neocloeon triangulifer TaxID=2078957 RepID=UPI00286F1D9B|nr:uncharacterized protein LOC132192879 [Neocloeon triangulifer]
MILKKVADTNPNLILQRPLTIWGPRFNNTCALYVNAFNVKFNNQYWQVQNYPNETFYLYGAYFDDRAALNDTADTGPFVRIIGMLNKRNYSRNLSCQFWFEDEDVPLFGNITENFNLWPEYWGYEDAELHPYIFSCRCPFKDRVPESVSLMINPCDNATNNLKVIDNQPLLKKKQNFLVCVKGLNYRHKADFSIRLVEWLELHKILGADKIVIYELQVHPNTSKVLEHYVQSGFVELVKTSLPGFYSNVPDLMSLFLVENLHVQIFQEVIQYNDCLYKYMNMYNFIVLVDMDEVILPLSSDTWYDLIYKKTIPKVNDTDKIPAAFVARNLIFADDKAEIKDWYPDIPKYMHLLQNVQRNVNYTFPPGDGVKSFHDPQIVFALHNHFPRSCIGYDNDWCPVHDFDLKDAHMQHYCTGKGKNECKLQRGVNLSVDTSIWKYKDRLIKATSQRLKEIGFF